MLRSRAIEATGLRTFRVYDRFDEHTPIWEGLATSAIHAMDRYVHGLDATYSGYSHEVESTPHSDGEVLSLYEFDGRVWGVCENTEIYAVEVFDTTPRPFPTITDSTVDAAVTEANDAFWEVVARHFPCETGDIEPTVIHNLNRVQDVTVRAWLEDNRPRTPRYVVTVYDVTRFTDDEVDAVILESGAQGESSEGHPDANVQSVTVETRDDHDTVVGTIERIITIDD
jgi:hypothetical protein